MNALYQRVIPRDLFNESKLLKCMGRLCLLIHDRQTPVEMSFEEIDKFKIGLMDEGCLTIVNLPITIKGIPLIFKTIYNSKNQYPLFVEHEYCDYLVFNEDGNFASEFINFANNLKDENNNRQ